MTLREEWERNAADYLGWTRTPEVDKYFWRLNLPTLLSLVPPPGKLTIDVGCGEGRFGRELLARGHTVLGVDASPTLAVAAATHAEPIRVVLGDAARLPLRSGVADIVTACLSLHDFDDLHGAVFEAARVLEPGGAFCFAVVHPINSAGLFDDRSVGGRNEVPDSYFERRRYSFETERAGHRMLFESFHYSLSDYALALETAGLPIEALREPVPEGPWADEDPLVQRWQRIPLSLHVRARKE